MNTDIKNFKVFKILNGKLVAAPEITDIHSYNHYYFHLHHFVKAQEYKRNMQWYIDNRIEEKLIQIPVLMHEHLESPIYGLSEEAFYRKYGIRKELLLFNRKKWIAEQVERRNK